MLRSYRILLVILGLVLALPAMGQQASVQGVITDPSGAIIVGVKITLTNISTGIVSTGETNAQGLYSVPSLVPGTYRLEANSAGFAPAIRDNLKLDVNMTARLDLVLKLGSTAEAVEVSAAAPLIDSETTTVGQVIDNKRIVELPLNGRNYLELARLTTGVTPDSGSRTNSKGTFSALGQHAYQTNVLLDGVDNNSRASGGQLGYEAQSVTPSIDAVAEFKVVTNNNSAEYGFRMGGTVIVQTKPGSNEFHGSLYEFLRNDKLDGTNFFSVGQPKPPYRRNQYGGSIGGRVIRDKTFFFASYEGTRIRNGETSVSTVPTVAQRAGVFGKPLFDPGTTRQAGSKWIRTPFGSNTIPATRFDSVARQVADLYPQPNLPGSVNNYYFSGSRVDDTDQIDTRLDHNLSSGHRLFGRYSRRMYDAVDPGPLPLPADGGLWTTTNLRSNSFVGNLNSTLSATVNNEFRAGVTRTDSALDIPWTENYNQKLGIRGIPDMGDDNGRGIARFTPSGYAELGARSYWPNRNNLDFWQFSDHIMKVSGLHVLKAGYEFRREYIFRRAARFARGQMAFNGSFTQDPNDRGRTGDGFADLLLGMASGGNFGNQNGETAVTLNHSLYFQDDWRINRRLTLNLGVRWDRFGPPSFKDSQVSRFEFAYGSQNYNILRPSGSRDSGARIDNNNFAPRLGLAWQADSKTVVRSGFGMFYGEPDAISHEGDARWANQPPDFTELTFPTDRLVQPALVVGQGFPAGLLPTTVVRENVTVKTASPFMPTQYAMQWFADVQRALPFETVVTLSYLGAESNHLVFTRNLNQPLKPAPGNIKNNRPWPFFGAINYRDASGTSSYQALAVKAEKRYAKGLTFLGSYTWAHNIDTGAGTLEDGNGGAGMRDHYNLSLNRGNSFYDIRHSLIGSGVYDLPFGKGRARLNRGGPADWVLGGWQLGGILTLRSGRPFTPTINGDLTNTGTANYPDRTGAGALPAGERSIDRWFDIASFAVPAPYVYGNSGRNILRGPGFAGVDFKLGKNFYFRERYRMEFRCEMFNATNTPHFGLPNTTVNLTQAGQIRSAADPRQIQFGLKLAY